MERGEQESGEDHMPRKRKKSSVYGMLTALTLVVAGYVYVTTHDLVLTSVIVLIGIAIVVVNR